MTIVFEGDKIILKSGKEITFRDFCKFEGVTIGCFDIDNNYYPLYEITY